MANFPTHKSILLPVKARVANVPLQLLGEAQEIVEEVGGIPICGALGPWIDESPGVDNNQVGFGSVNDGNIARLYLGHEIGGTVTFAFPLMQAIFTRLNLGFLDWGDTTYDVTLESFPFPRNSQNYGDISWKPDIDTDPTYVIHTPIFDFAQTAAYIAANQGPHTFHAVDGWTARRPSTVSFWYAAGGTGEIRSLLDDSGGCHLLLDGRIYGNTNPTVRVYYNAPSAPTTMVEINDDNGDEDTWAIAFERDPSNQDNMVGAILHPAYNGDSDNPRIRIIRSVDGGSTWNDSDPHILLPDPWQGYGATSPHDPVATGKLVDDNTCFNTLGTMGAYNSMLWSSQGWIFFLPGVFETDPTVLDYVYSTNGGASWISESQTLIDRLEFTDGIGNPDDTWFNWRCFLSPNNQKICLIQQRISGSTTDQASALILTWNGAGFNLNMDIGYLDDAPWAADVGAGNVTTPDNVFDAACAWGADDETMHISIHNDNDERNFRRTITCSL